MTTQRPLRVRYVMDGAHCAACGKTLYPARTVSGVTTEHYCSGECAWRAYLARPCAVWRDDNVGEG